MGANVSLRNFVLSLPGDALYLREQATAAKAVAVRLGVGLQVVSAQMDPVLQSQQLLDVVHSRGASRTDAILLEPVSASGLPRVAEAAVAAGIGWAVSNALVEYLGTLRKNAKAPVFLVSQNHVEIGRIQGRQLGAMLPKGGTVLYLRGPSMSSVASLRYEGLASGKPANVEIKSVKVQGSTEEDAARAVTSWLALSPAKPEGIEMIVSQNADFIFGARKAFEKSAAEAERAKWLALPCTGVGILRQAKPLVDQGVLRAAVLTSLTMDTVLEMMTNALGRKLQPQEQTFVDARSYPSLEALAKGRIEQNRRESPMA